MDSEHNVPLFGLSCREASRLISESLDRELTRRERWSLRIHAAICTACQRFAKQIKLLRDAIAEAPEAARGSWAEGAQLSAERKALMKSLLADASQIESQD
jgi:hypothetical protein